MSFIYAADLFADIQPFIQSAFDGFNVSLFAYGQTSSGKTHTMVCLLILFPILQYSTHYILLTVVYCCKCILYISLFFWYICFFPTWYIYTVYGTWNHWSIFSSLFILIRSTLMNCIKDVKWGFFRLKSVFMGMVIVYHWPYGENRHGHE